MCKHFAIKAHCQGNGQKACLISLGACAGGGRRASILKPSHIAKAMARKCYLVISMITCVRVQAVEDAQAGREPAAPPVPPAEAGQEAVVAAVLASAYAQMDQDRKSTALKALQARRCHPPPGHCRARHWY